METRTEAAERLETDIAESRTNDDAAYYLVQYLADWGPEHVDVQALAERCLTVES